MLDSPTAFNPAKWITDVNVCCRGAAEVRREARTEVTTEVRTDVRKVRLWVDGRVSTKHSGKIHSKKKRMKPKENPKQTKWVH